MKSLNEITILSFRGWQTISSYWQLVEVVPQFLSKAEELVKAENVRTLDAIHIASAIIIQDFFPTPLPFISADERQLAAAQNCRLSVVAIT